MRCRLCDHQNSNVFLETSGKTYWTCSRCNYLFLDSKNFLSSSDEKFRYEQHQNDIHSKGYVQFLEPVVRAVQNDYSGSVLNVLDYGCGPGPVLAELFRRKGHQVFTYDPYFESDSLERLGEGSFDVITCTEAFEHFYRPAAELQTMIKLLKPGGRIYLKTEFFTGQTPGDFERWYYRKDPTHVGFLCDQSFEALKRNLQKEASIPFEIHRVT